MEQKNEFNSFSLINYVWTWRKLFIIVCLTTAILSFLIAMLIRPQFQSTTTIYAPRTNSVSQILTNENNINERLDVKAYAIEEATEQMMQILNSREIKDFLIEKYDLINYYGIDTKGRHWKTKLYETVEGFLKFKRTQYGAINITTTDWDPERAAQMANDIADELDIIKHRIEKERTAAAFKAMELQVADVEAQRKQVVDSMNYLAQKGVLVYENQAERVMQQYAIALAQGNTAGVQRLKKEIDKLEEWGPASFALQEELIWLSKQLAFYKAKLLNAQMDMKELMPVKFVIEKAVPSDKKSYPKKLVISIISTISAFVLTLMTLLFVDKVRREIVVEDKINKSEKTE